MGRLLALDVGDRRIGVALSDPMHIIASPHSVIDRKITPDYIHEVQKLISEGLAYEKPRQGAYVSKFETKDLLPAFQVRLVLDGLAAKLSSKQISKEFIFKLERIMTMHRTAIDANDPDKYTNADIQFHTALLECSNNPLLKETAKSIYYQIYAAMKTRVAPLGPEVTYQDHLLIYNAVINGKEQEAENAARDHVDHIITQILEIST